LTMPSTIGVLVNDRGIQCLSVLATAAVLYRYIFRSARVAVHPGNAAVVYDPSRNTIVALLGLATDPTAAPQVAKGTTRYFVKPWHRLWQFPVAVLDPYAGTTTTIQVQLVDTMDGPAYVTSVAVTMRYHIAQAELARYLVLNGPQPPTEALATVVNRAVRAMLGDYTVAGATPRAEEVMVSFLQEKLRAKLLCECGITVQEVSVGALNTS
jgi:hypothetical protein